MKRVEEFLRNEIGLDAASLGRAAIERAARLRMKSLELKEPGEYHRLLATSRIEREELIEAVVVPETWFFRDANSFAAFLQLAQKWFGANPSGKLRVLSVPCSSGEEPYSVAMCLLDAGVPRERFTIDAMDISARTLERASHAVYGKNSFRGKDLSFRDRHFLQGKNGFALHARVRGCVNFHQDNLLNSKLLDSREPYQFIFCRNLLVYFHRDMQLTAASTLRRKLADDGFIFVAPAEVPIFLGKGFVSADLPMSSACRKATDTAFLRKNRASRALNVSGTLATLAYRGDQSNSNDRAANSAAAETDLGKARKLADAGKFAEATSVCRAHLTQHGPSAEAFYLLGLVHDASGDAGAAEFYRKALYLDPDHSEALIHLALLLEKKGQRDEAQSLRRRAQRRKK